MHVKLFILIMSLALTSCVTTDEILGTDNTKDKELGNSSYIPYQYIHTNPPDKLLPSPTFIHSAKGEYTYYKEKELEAYADALMEYHGYLERYIRSLEGSDGKPLVTIGRERCLIELARVTVITPPPNRPIPPTYSSVEKSEGTDLMISYLNEVDKWIENLEKHNSDSVRQFNKHITSIKEVCSS